MAKCMKFISRIVIVPEENMDDPWRTLSRILAVDGLVEDSDILRNLAICESKKVAKSADGSKT